MANTEKEFLEWKIDFLKDQIEWRDMILEEEENLDAGERKSLEEDIKNIKAWIKELKAKKRKECTEKDLKWKIDFLKERIEEVDMNRELAEGDDDYMELLENDDRNIKAWIKELKNGQNRQK